MKCVCGFKFAGAGEYRNCEAFITQEGKSGIVCPDCGKSYVDGNLVVLSSSEEKDNA